MISYSSREDQFHKILVDRKEFHMRAQNFAVRIKIAKQLCKKEVNMGAPENPCKCTLFFMRFSYKNINVA